MSRSSSRMPFGIARGYMTLSLAVLVGLLLVSSANAQNATDGDPAVQPTTSGNGTSTNGGGTSTNGSPPSASTPPSSPAPATAGASVMPAGGTPPAVTTSGGCSSINQALQAYDFLTTFRSALEAAGMDSALDDPELTITLLAPTNSAFSSALSSLNLTADDLFAQPALLRRILQLHIIPVPLDSSVFMSDTLSAPTLDFGSELQVSTEGDVTTVTANGASATVVDLEVANVCEPGEVYVITGVLLPTNITLPEAAAPAGVPVEELPEPIAGIVSAFPFLAPFFGAATPADAPSPFAPFFPAGTPFTAPGFPFTPDAAGATPTAGAATPAGAPGAVPGFPFAPFGAAPGTAGTPFTLPTFPGTPAAAAPTGTGGTPAAPAASPFALFFPGAPATPAAPGAAAAPAFPFFGAFGAGEAFPGLTPFALFGTGGAAPAAAAAPLGGLFPGGFGAFVPAAGFVPGAAAVPAAGGAAP